MDAREVYLYALTFADEAHEGQFRKYTGAPYLTHVVRVSEAARECGLGADAEAVALLHDTVEDTWVEREDLVVGFGPVVAGMVWGLTNAEGRGVATPRVDNRAKRKAMDREWLGGQTVTVRALKLLDLADNLREMDPRDSFLDLFLTEAAELRKVLASDGEARGHAGLGRALVRFDAAWGRARDARQAERAGR